VEQTPGCKTNMSFIGDSVLAFYLSLWQYFDLPFLKLHPILSCYF